MVVIYYYLERDNGKILNFYLNNSYLFEISTTLLSAALQ